MQKINFCETEYMVLSNFSAHEVEFRGVSFKTAEHCYHSCRYTDKEIQKDIENAKSAREAWNISQKYKSYQKEWFEEEKLALMEAILREKYKQHPDVREVLEKSGQKILLKEHEFDSFWWTGKDGKGKNMLWKIWMRIRQEMFWER